MSDPTDIVYLVRGELVTVIPARRYTIMRASGKILECGHGLPDGYWVGDYFRDGIYLGPDVHEVEPSWAPVAADEPGDGPRST